MTHDMQIGFKKSSIYHLELFVTIWQHYNSSNVPYKLLAWDALPIKNKSNDIEEVKAFYSDLTSKTLEGDRLVTF